MTSTTLSICPSEIRSISSVANEVITVPVNAYSSDTQLSKVNLGDAELTCLVIPGLEGDPETLVDIQTGIVYTLLPVDTRIDEEVIDNVVNIPHPFESLPAGVS